MFYEDPADYLDFLPDRLQGIAEIDAIAGTVNIQIDKLSAYIRQHVDNRFPSTADESGCARWEKMLGISAPLNGTLQARRDAIRSKIMTKPPINLKTLQSIVEAYMGLPVGITLDGYQVRIKYRGESRIADLNPLYATMWTTIPANMLVDIAYLYATWGEVKAVYSTWGDVKAKTWEQIHKGV